MTYSQRHNITSKGNDYGYLYLYKLKKMNESLCLIKHQAKKAYRGVDVQLHTISTFAKVVVSFTFWPLYPGKKGNGTNSIVGHMDL